MRELNFQTTKKSGSEKSNKKQYVYFNQLLFLKPSTDKRKTCSSLDPLPTNNYNANDQSASDDQEGTVDDTLSNQETDVGAMEEMEQPSETATAVKVDVRPASMTSKKRSRENVLATEMRILNDISRRLNNKPQTQQTKRTENEDDPDKLFLLSLLPDIKKIHEDDRLEMKGEIISLINKWKRSRQCLSSRNQNRYDIPMHNSSFTELQSTSGIFPSQNNAFNHHRVLSPSVLSDTTCLQSPGSSENSTNQWNQY